MVAYNKIQDFTEQLGLGKHVFGTDVLEVCLTDTAPVATNTILGNLVPIAYTNYSDTLTADRVLEGDAWVEVTGTSTLDADDFTITAVTGALPQWQYLALFNQTQSSPVDPLICWWDNGSAINLALGESIVIDFGADAGTDGDIFTLV